MEISAIGSILATSVATSAPAKTPEQQAERQQLVKAIKKLNKTELLGSDNELTFVLDRETQRPLVRIVDRETREVVRQIPPEYVLRMAEDLDLYDKQG